MPCRGGGGGRNLTTALPSEYSKVMSLLKPHFNIWMFTSSYVEDGGEAKIADASFRVYQGMSAKVKHLKSG